MKMKRLRMRANSNMFALLCPSVASHINDLKKVISATRFHHFHDTSGAPLSDAVGYPKLFRPRSHFPGFGEWNNLRFTVKGL
jgi:hypothetical protein